MTVRALIVDDEPLARTRLRALLQQETEVEIVGEAETVHAGLDLIDRTRPDVLFLDVQMQGESGFDLLRKLDSRWHPAVIFTTAYSSYAAEAFNEDAADYLVKPFNRERVLRALDRARKLNYEKPAARQPTPPRERFVVRNRGEIIFVTVANVDWISAEGNYVRLHSGASSYLLREPMQSVEESLDASAFVRVHRSAIVKLERIRKLVTSSDGTPFIVLSTGDSVPLGPSYRSRLEDAIREKL
jgi:two-component system LytT family response regulator